MPYKTQPIRCPRNLLDETGSRRQPNMRAEDQVGRPGEAVATAEPRKRSFTDSAQREVPVASHFGISGHGNHSHPIASNDNVQRIDKRANVVLYAPDGFQRRRQD